MKPQGGGRKFPGEVDESATGSVIFFGPDRFSYAARMAGTMADLLDVDCAMFDYGDGVSMPPAASIISVPPGPAPVVPGR
jgi:hypothetical protein